MATASADYFKLPSSPIEINSLVKTHYHRGMKLVDASLHAHRACNQAILFVYGLTGAGKTSSLNHLFGFEIIPKSKERTSDTHNVTEYVATMNSEAWEVTNLEIGFIDLPGWADTHGDIQDARNMATIEQYITNHRHLGSRLYKCYPNIILLTFNIMDERIEGRDSNAAKMLRVLSELKIVDTKRPNVIVVLTHAKSIPPLNYSETIKSIELSIQTLTRTYLQVEAPVILLENNTTGFLLKTEGEWTILYDDILQPKNLFDQMIELMTDSEDEVGVEAIRLYFHDRGKNKPIKRCALPTDRVSQMDQKRWQTIIISKFKTLVETEVVRMIKKYYTQRSELKSQQLLPIMFELHKAGFTEKIDFNELNIDDVQERITPYVLSDLEKNVLMEVFNVKSRTFPDLVNYVGRGYDTSTRKVCHRILKPLTEYYTSHGVNVPTCMRTVPIEEIRVNCNVEFIDKDIEACQEKTPPKLHLEKSFENQDSNLPGLKPTCMSPPLSPITCVSMCIADHIDTYRFTFSVIQILIRIQLVLFKDIIKLVEEEFIKDVNDLPDVSTHMGLEGPVVNESYMDFFKKYGQYFILECDSGGLIEGELSLQSRDYDLNRTKSIVEKYVQLYLASLQTGTKIEGRDQLSEEVFNKIMQAPITWEGGVKPEFRENLNDIDHETWQTWINSLKKKAIVLSNFENNVRSMPIFKFVSLINESKGNKMRDALMALHPDIQYFEIEDLKLEENPKNALEATIHIERFGPRRRTMTRSLRLNETAKPLTRELASEQAETGACDRSKGGFPGIAKLWKREVNGDCRETEIKQLVKGDHVLSANKYGKVMYQIINEIERNDTKQVEYLTISDNLATVTIGYRHRIMHGQVSRPIAADKLKLGSKIYRYEMKATETKQTKVKTIGFVREQGNYLPEVNGNVIVDGIVCEKEDACFPGNASVTLKGGEKVRMDKVKIGDYVLSIHPSTGKPVYSKVYLWAHRDPHVTATFLHITHPHGHLHISANHLILSGEQRRPVPAGHLAVGDTIHSLLSPAATATATAISVPVLHIHTCTQVGYYAPFTNNGLIVVDGIASSVYSQPSTRSHAHVCASVTGGLVEQFGLHRVGECVMTPVRVGCKLGVGSLILTKQMDTTTHIHKYCQWLMKLYHNLN